MSPWQLYVDTVCNYPVAQCPVSSVVREKIRPCLCFWSYPCCLYWSQQQAIWSETNTRVKKEQIRRLQGEGEAAEVWDGPALHAHLKLQLHHPGEAFTRVKQLMFEMVPSTVSSPPLSTIRKTSSVTGQDMRLRKWLTQFSSWPWP